MKGFPLQDREAAEAARDALADAGRERLKQRHEVHVVVREVIDRWDRFREKLHLGDRINLAAEITEAVMRMTLTASERKDGGK